MDIGCWDRRTFEGIESQELMGRHGNGRSMLIQEEDLPSIYTYKTYMSIPVSSVHDPIRADNHIIIQEQN